MTGTTSSGTSSGTRPSGVSGEEAASRWVRGMFGRIAGRYDLLNHLLSFNLDKRWRARAVERVADVLERPGTRVLDLCCGTGDVLLSLEARRGSAVLGSDFCHPMLLEARRKISARRMRSPLFEAHALALPLREDSLDLITVAFGFRNLANHARLILARVLARWFTILEFSKPPWVFGKLCEPRSVAVGGWDRFGSARLFVCRPSGSGQELADGMRGRFQERSSLKLLTFP
jgi:demethylmenaquinone methyltransferase/2-methoxy-6-polyprenyl-1,4-benzoquinol methylase